MSKPRGSSFVSWNSAERDPNDEAIWENSISVLSDKLVDIVSSSDLTVAEINNYLMVFRDTPRVTVSNAFD